MWLGTANLYLEGKTHTHREREIVVKVYRAGIQSRYTEQVYGAGIRR